MIISESGLCRNLKDAYKHGGYTITTDGDTQVCIYTKQWYIRIPWHSLPRKALATIVEQIGLPRPGAAMLCRKGHEPQMAMPETIGAEVGAWEEMEREESGVEYATFVPMVIKATQLFQTDDLHAYGFGLMALDLLLDSTTQGETTQIITGGEAGIRGRWEEDEGAMVSIIACRPTAQYWAEESEKDVWAALEGVDLHLQK